jgi:hypothetical protein
MMTKLIALDATAHAGKAWRRPENYDFAAQDAVVAITGLEFSQVGRVMPIAFIAQGDRYDSVAVMSLLPGRNMFVGPSGQWLGSYVPFALRTFPFRAVPLQGREDSALCVVEDSGLIVDADGTAEPLFDAEGRLAASVEPVWKLLFEIDANRRNTAVAIAVLQEVGLICPWNIMVKVDGVDRVVDGLFRIDEVALNGLDDAAFLKLRRVGAVPLAYIQLLSMGQLEVFAQLDLVQQQLMPRQAKPQIMPQSLDEVFAMPSDGMIRFD